MVDAEAVVMLKAKSQLQYKEESNVAKGHSSAQSYVTSPEYLLYFSFFSKATDSNNFIYLKFSRLQV